MITVESRIPVEVIKITLLKLFMYHLIVNKLAEPPGGSNMKEDRPNNLMLWSGVCQV